MLTKAQQILLIQLLNKRLKEIKLKERTEAYLKSEEQEAYKSNYSFHRGINYLVDSGFVHKKKMGGENYYILSIKGELLATLLTHCKDLPEDMEKVSLW